jgi:hypothetical protein
MVHGTCLSGQRLNAIKWIKYWTEFVNQNPQSAKSIIFRDQALNKRGIIPSSVGARALFPKDGPKKA